MLAINAETLRAMISRESGMRAARQQEIVEGMGAPMAGVLDGYGINTPLRIAHFLAQVAHESDDFCTTEEYASGQKYEGRRDLGNVEPGDGQRYKGRGLIQLTGRANYRAVGARLGLDLEGGPQLVGNPFVYLLVSCEFWKEKDINPLCDQDDVIAVTQRVNGGQNGIDDRKAYLLKAKALVAALVAGGAAALAPGMPVLHLGMSGEAVTALQRRLLGLHYPVAIDGDFGAPTELAVKHFQADAGLAADGVVGAQTWGRMTGPA